MNKFLKKMRSLFASARDVLTEQKWVFLKAAAYAGIVIFFYIVFLWFLFPYHELVSKLSAELKTRTSMDLTVEKAHGAFPLGLTLSGVVLSEQAGTGESPLIEARTVRIVPGILSLLRGWVSLRVYGQLYNGQIWIDGGSNRKDYTLSCVIKDIDISRYSLIKNNYGLNIQGVVDAKLTMKGSLNDVTKDSGKGLITMKKAHLNSSKIFGIFTLPDINFGDVNLPIFIKDGRLSFQNATQTSSDMNSKLEGSILFLNPVSTSMLNLRLKFNPSATMEQQIKKAIPFFNLNRDALGYFNVPITGSIGMPDFQ